jgi:hypothetical protein
LPCYLEDVQYILVFEDYFEAYDPAPEGGPGRLLWRGTYKDYPEVNRTGLSRWMRDFDYYCVRCGRWFSCLQDVQRHVEPYDPETGDSREYPYPEL